MGEKVGEKEGEKVGEKTGEKVGESLGEIDKLNLCLYVFLGKSANLNFILLTKKPLFLFCQRVF